MTQEKETEKTKRIISGKMSREELCQAVLDPNSVTILKDKKKFAIPTGASIKVDFEKLVRDLDIAPNTLRYRLTKLFCDEKKADEMNAKGFVSLIKNLNDGQLRVVELLCCNSDFSISTILKSIPSIKKFDDFRLLSLHSFIELDSLTPGQLNHFFLTTLVQSDLKKVEKKIYEKEAREKAMSHDQHNVFYNICYQIKGIAPSDAITLLRNIRTLKPQHAKIMNTFLKKGVVLDNQPISNTNILKLTNLWLALPELPSNSHFLQFVKFISKKSKLKHDFGDIISYYRSKLMKE